MTAEQVGASAPCDVDDINEAAPPTIDSDMLRLAPVSGDWLSPDDACPSLSEFEAALP